MEKQKLASAKSTPTYGRTIAMTSHQEPYLERSSSSQKVQKVVFVRHGVARHNLPDPITGNRPVLEDPALLDPPLVYQGKAQALDAGERLRIWWRTTQGGEELELIITSPLTRCIQTTMYGFLPGDAYTDGRKEPKVVCTEMVREAYGMHYPDKRRDLSVLKAHWPNLQFDKRMTEKDEAWSSNNRETVDQLRKRIQLFMKDLIQLEETNIVVVSHGVWIEVCLNSLCPEALEYGNRRVYNCDMFSGECISENGIFVRLENFSPVE